MKTTVILVGAGKGIRIGQPKLLLPMAGKSLLEWNLETLIELPFQTEIVIVVDAEMISEVEDMLKNKNISARVVEGGEERIVSVRKGVEAASGDILLIQNVANPLASSEDYVNVRQILLARDAAVFVGQKVVDTLRKMKVETSLTVDRENVWRVQTPQGFRKASLIQVLETSDKMQKMTDEVMLFEGSETQIVALETSPQNQKITYPQDLSTFERFLSSETLLGIGEDSHAFDETGTMTLGGVLIEGLPKLKGNSDGDLILHALFNAISSALGKRSIGPTADPMAEQGIIDSAEYLRIILRDMKQASLFLSNVSISLEGAQPKIEPLVNPLKASLSQLLELLPERIGITATSGEALTPFGEGKGLRCLCAVSLKLLSSPK